jgi:hypothetical protein
MWRVVVCDHENLVNEEAIARGGLQSQRNNQTTGSQNPEDYDVIRKCRSKAGRKL